MLLKWNLRDLHWNNNCISDTNYPYEDDDNDDDDDYDWFFTNILSSVQSWDLDNLCSSHQRFVQRDLPAPIWGTIWLFILFGICIWQKSNQFLPMELTDWRTAVFLDFWLMRLWLTSKCGYFFDFKLRFGRDYKAEVWSRLYQTCEVCSRFWSRNVSELWYLRISTVLNNNINYVIIYRHRQ